MDRRRRKHRSAVCARQRRLLQARVDELHFTGAGHLVARPRDQLFPGFDCHHPQPPREQAARQLPRAAADLQHPSSRSEPCYLAGAVDQRIRVSRPVAVILVSNLVEHSAVAANLNAVDHGSQVQDRG